MRQQQPRIARNGRSVALALALAMLALALGGASGATGPADANAVPFGLHVVGNHLATLSGRPLRLLGVDRSGAEYMCVFKTDDTVFDGPTDAASIAAIKSWHTNAVRVPLNEDCWLNINGADQWLSGATYRHAIERYATRSTPPACT